jgi:chemotaxis protein methyltransferase CheR
MTLETLISKIHKATGVQFGEAQRSMVESRLQKRIHELKLITMSDYLKYFEANEIEETKALVSLLTTHHTFFFRETRHFDFLEQEGLKALESIVLARPDKTLRIWSAACSRGQEVYSISMFLQKNWITRNPALKYEILGTDIDPESVSHAQNGVYAYSEIKSIPMDYVKGHWLKGTSDIADFVKAKSSIKAPCKFKPLNLFEFGDSTKKNEIPDGHFDLIFCRNVFIYFNESQIKTICENMVKKLQPQGHLIIGLSESITKLGLPVTSLGSSIYKNGIEKAGTVTASGASTVKSAVGASKPSKPKEVERPLRVFCIDDSPSIHTLFKQVLTKENGFEIVGTALNGIEASQKIGISGADVATLDIHMPEMDGLTYLQKFYSDKHVPVVMISSVSREDSGLAQKALQLGASDYVEKPALSNLKERGDEIRMKLRCAFKANRKSGTGASELDASFQRHQEIKNPEKKLRWALFHLPDQARIKRLLTEFQGPQPATVLLIGGSGLSVALLAEQWTKSTGRKIESWNFEAGDKLKPGTVYLAPFEAGYEKLKNLKEYESVCGLVYGETPDHWITKIKGWSGITVLVEDLDSKTSAGWKSFAADIVPATSFGYMSSEALMKDVASKKAA